MEPDYFYVLIVVLASLYGVYFSFVYSLHFRGLIYTGVGDQERNRRLVRGAQTLLLVCCLAFTGSLVHLFNLSRQAVVPPATATQIPGEGASQLTSTPNVSSPIVLTSTPAGSPTPEAIPGTGTALIGNTNGYGANIRVEPGLKFEMLIQLSDGSRVELTGEVQSADGFNWQRVRLEDGRLGWVAENFLIPEP